MHVIKKARSITDAEIQFISLVDKAANKKDHGMLAGVADHAGR